MTSGMTTGSPAAGSVGQAAPAFAGPCPRLAPDLVSGEIRSDWTKAEIARIYFSPLLELVYQSASVHRRYHDPRAIQQCTLLSIKTGGCSENCGYCPQSAHHSTAVKPEGVLDQDSVEASARAAKEAGSDRFCMGAAWREVHDNTQFQNILAMVRRVKALDMEVCVTLGMLSAEQAKQLKAAGLTAYNHNLDTSAGFYDKIVTTRTYQDRLNTLKNVRDAGIAICCGGIIGMGESAEDRIDLLHTLATLPEHPESVPVNALVAVKGTPLEERPPVDVLEMVRMIAAARIVMPAARIRLSAGRAAMSYVEQALCFLAGANSLFTGEKLLTTPNCDSDADRQMFDLLGLQPIT